MLLKTVHTLFWMLLACAVLALASPAYALQDDLSGELTPFGALTWVLDLTEGRPLIVMVEGAGTTISPVLASDGEAVTPVLALTRVHDDSRTVTVFVPEESGSYSLTVESTADFDAGDVQVRFFGSMFQVVALLPVLEPESERAESEARMAYGLLAERGTEITVVVGFDANEVAYATVYASDGSREREQYTFISEGSTSTVYGLQGPPPYWIVVESEDDHRLAVREGDRVREALGRLEAGQMVSGQPNADRAAGLYSMEVSAGVYTFILNGTGYPDLQVHGADGTRLLPDAFSTHGEEARQRYTLEDGRYAVTVASAEPYSLTVSAGDALTLYRGELKAGVVRDEASIAPQTSVYSLNAEAGNTLTLEVESETPPFAMQLFDVLGEEIFSQGAMGSDTEQRRAFTLTGEPPYQLRIEAAGAYRLSVMAGDLTRIERGAIAPGSSVTETLQGETVVYSLNAEQDSVLTLSAPSGYPVIAVLAGETPLLIQRVSSEHDLTQNVFQVELSEPGPYRLELTGQGTIALTIIDRGSGFALDVLGRDINLRAGPGTQFSALAQADEGDALLAVGRNRAGDWIQVTRDDGLSAWISATLVRPQNSSDTFELLPLVEDGDSPADAGVSGCTLTALNAVNVRAEPSTDAAVQAVLSTGRDVTGISQRTINNQTWWRLEGGGWVRSDTVDETRGCAALPAG